MAGLATYSELEREIVCLSVLYVCFDSTSELCCGVSQCIPLSEKKKCSSEVRHVNIFKTSSHRCRNHRIPAPIRDF
jgi:hypothetical protein